MMYMQGCLQYRDERLMSTDLAMGPKSLALEQVRVRSFHLQSRHPFLDLPPRTVRSG
jgi:hypothetical protein